MSGLVHDLKMAGRVWAKLPGQLAIILLTLMLGTGANVAMFSVADATTFRPLPVAEPTKLMRVVSSMPGGLFCYQDYLELARDKGVVSAFAGTSMLQLFVEDTESPRTLSGNFVSATYFSALGVRPALGRDFLPEEDALPQGRPVAVISHQLWDSQFQSAPDVLGKTLRLNGVVFTVVGVAPRGFSGTSRATRVDVWLPATAHPLVIATGPRVLTDRNAHWFSLLARLAPGVTARQAEEQFDAIVNRMMKTQGRADLEMRVWVYTEWEAQSKLSSQSTFLQIGLFALVSLVLLMACINVANLILGKATGRRKEIALRLALGATRGRVIRQLLTEGFALSLVGTGLGLALATAVVDIVVGYRSAAVPFAAIDARIDGRALLASLVVCAIATVMVGLAPVLDAGEWDLSVTLKNGGQAPRRVAQWRRGGRVLVVAQVTLCSLLLVFTGLFVRSVQKAWQLDPGFRTDQLLVASINLAPLKIGEPALPPVWRRLQDRVRALPGVAAAAYASHYPLDKTPAWTNIVVDGREAKESLSRIYVGPDYFATMRIGLVRGREFRDQDRSEGTVGVVVDEATAEHYWPGQDPVGKIFLTGKGANPPARVVGVARTVMYDMGVADQHWRERIYVNVEQKPRTIEILHIQTTAAPEELRAAVMSALQTVEPRAHVAVFTVGESIGYALEPMRVGQAILGVMGALGLILAAIGLYGVLSSDVGRRVKELGVRLAIGAEPKDLKWMVVRESLPVVGAGLALGLGIALALTPAFREVLIRVGPRDPVAFLTTATVVFAISLLASYFPARRASRVKVLVALRME